LRQSQTAAPNYDTNPHREPLALLVVEVKLRDGGGFGRFLVRASTIPRYCAPLASAPRR
jgi:hypothetical protein